MNAPAVGPSGTTAPAAGPRSVAQWLARAREVGLDRVDAYALLGHHLGQDRAWLIAHDDAAVALEVAQRFDADCARRAQGEPLAYLTGWREFHGLQLQVAPAVLVPRPDTETLVDWALELMQAEAALAAVDLGTGSGAIALALAHRRRAAQLTATDISAEALAVAAANARRLGLHVEFAQGRWWDAVAGRRFDLAVSNPPYIAATDPHLAGLRHEPLLALSPGGDGLDALREIVATAPRHLHDGAWLLLEHGWDQADVVQALLRARGYADVATRADLGGQPRCSGGRWTGFQKR